MAAVVERVKGVGDRLSYERDTIGRETDGSFFGYSRSSVHRLVMKDGMIHENLMQCTLPSKIIAVDGTPLFISFLPSSLPPFHIPSSKACQTASLR